MARSWLRLWSRRVRRTNPGGARERAGERGGGGRRWRPQGFRNSRRHRRVVPLLYLFYSIRILIFQVELEERQGLRLAVSWEREQVDTLVSKAGLGLTNELVDLHKNVTQSEPNQVRAARSLVSRVTLASRGGARLSLSLRHSSRTPSQSQPTKCSPTSAPNSL